MKMMTAIFGVLLLLLPAAAQATPPCMPQTPEEFAATKAASDLIVHGIITGYGSADSPSGWTDIKTVQSYKGDAPESLRISGWTSYFMPLYNYDKGTELLLLLKKDGGTYTLTDMSWKKCVPAVIYLPSEEQLQKPDGTGLTRADYIEKTLNPAAKTAE